MRQNQFSKLKKAIKNNDKISIARALMSLPVLAKHPARARKALTRGAYLKNEINRALRGLGQTGNWSPQLNEAFEVVKARAGEDVWNEVIYKAPETSSEPASIPGAEVATTS